MGATHINQLSMRYISARRADTGRCEKGSIDATERSYVLEMERLADFFTLRTPLSRRTPSVARSETGAALRDACYSPRHKFRTTFRPLSADRSSQPPASI